MPCMGWAGFYILAVGLTGRVHHTPVAWRETKACKGWLPTICHLHKPVCETVWLKMANGKLADSTRVINVKLRALYMIHVNHSYYLLPTWGEQMPAKEYNKTLPYYFAVLVRTQNSFFGIWPCNFKSQTSCLLLLLAQQLPSNIYKLFNCRNTQNAQINCTVIYYYYYYY